MIHSGVCFTCTSRVHILLSLGEVFEDVLWVYLVDSLFRSALAVLIFCVFILTMSVRLGVVTQVCNPIWEDHGSRSAQTKC
jgi:hypothetical protein